MSKNAVGILESLTPPIKAVGFVAWLIVGGLVAWVAVVVVLGPAVGLVMLIVEGCGKSLGLEEDILPPSPTSLVD